ncbi:hypothetical protein AM493_17905 [Flavobacterium akiainvivens]|uniref:Lipocalin-like domain-containing protein n=1 Tax=Flavobacterium akiainvivens TaxID=1202724 RepID=A0A0M9VJQ3_9FLAO|nr:hypothetical protein [Flavobacterium akiainvivens]KOS07709.1 hypothetical protein AM493_17905 [Flavobacterium akiainvivens]SFQ24738.1 hypothetical protein SAMN05444144_102162 [Flavobacterium akiainvivens]
MKKITLFAALASVLFVSCSDDDNNNAQPVGGTWVLTKIVLPDNIAYDANGDGVISENHLDETSCFDTTSIIFGASNTAVFTGHCLSESDGPELTSYIQQGSNVTFSYASTPTYNRTATYVLNGNTLTATLNYESDDYVPGYGNFADTSIFLYGATLTYTKM